MVASLLLAAAAAAAAPDDFGPSPLVDQGHAHRWSEVQNDEEGTGWVDLAWRSQAVVDGTQLELVLVRGDVKIDSPMVLDIIMAVDCRRDLMGIRDGWLHKSEFAEKMRLPVGKLEMDFAETPPNAEERRIIDFACKTGRAAE